MTPFHDPNQPPCDYERAPEYDVLAERDTQVPMRDGVRLAVDVFRPDGAGRMPALVAFGVHSKDLQGPDYPGTVPPQPSFSAMWVGHQEAGDTRFFVSRGYVHVVAAPRGFHGSDSGGSREWDGYDLIEWVAAQPWCSGEVGMIGIGAFASEQWHAARQKPPHLKAIFPYDGRGALGTLGSFREEYPGGVLHTFRYLGDHFSTAHGSVGAPGELTPERQALWEEAMANPDFRMWPHLWVLLNLKGQRYPRVFDLLLDPYEAPGSVDRAEAEIAGIDLPVKLGAGWYGQTYKSHLTGAQNYFERLRGPKWLILAGPGHPDRPLRTLRAEMLEWYDHWLKARATDIEGRPSVRFFAMGENAWHGAADWPVPGTEWRKLYLQNWERLVPEAPSPGSVDDRIPPDSFVQMPPTQTGRVDGLRYLSEPMPRDTLVAGPMALVLHAAIDAADTNWIVTLKDVGPDPKTRTARPGEREIGADVPERVITRGWLKASMRDLDPERTQPWKPWHRLTRASRVPVPPGEVVRYDIELMAAANSFRRGHRICIEIASLDLPTGVSGSTDVEYIPYHICSARTVVHHIHHDPEHPSHLVLPVVPEGASERL